MTKSEPQTSYLGPATVINIQAELGLLDVRLPSGDRLNARLALAVPYQPVEGDELLVTTQDGRQVYVIGVLQGAGLNTWRVPADFAIEAPEGGISLTCAGPMRFKSKGKMDISSPKMMLRATRMEFSAQRLVNRVGDAYLWVKGLFQVKSSRYRAVADESFLLKTKRARMKSAGNFNIDGKTIHLG